MYGEMATVRAFRSFRSSISLELLLALLDSQEAVKARKIAFVESDCFPRKDEGLAILALDVGKLQGRKLISCGTEYRCFGIAWVPAHKNEEVGDDDGDGDGEEEDHGIDHEAINHFPITDIT